MQNRKSILCRPLEPEKRRSLVLTVKPIIIGISGASASGKSLLANTIVNELGSNKVVVISEDAYYRDHSNIPFEDRTKINYDHPDALDHELLCQHLGQLSTGKTVNIPIYNHALHTREKKNPSCWTTHYHRSGRYSAFCRQKIT
jgi:uridine kinase